MLEVVMMVVVVVEESESLDGCDMREDEGRKEARRCLPAPKYAHLQSVQEF